jgi:DNA adenine methylase
MAKRLSFFPYLGGKHYLLKTILKNIPNHRIYVEPFGGSAKVLLNKEPSEIEVYNDYDKRIANLFYVVAFKFDEFFEKVNRLLFSREIYNQAVKDFGSSKIDELGNVDLAVMTYYKLHGTFSGQLNSKSFRTSFTRSLTKSFFNNLDTLTLIHDRLKNVVIESLDFKKLIKRYSEMEDVFIYLDPPYLGFEFYYDVKFTLEDHKAMLDILKNSKAKWLLSNYANELYDTELKDFYRLEIPLSKHSYALTESTKHKRNTKPTTTEILWANYEIKL